MASHNAFIGTEFHNHNGNFLVGNNITLGSGGNLIVGGSFPFLFLNTPYMISFNLTPRLFAAITRE
jgi:hypothetical protein